MGNEQFQKQVLLMFHNKWLVKLAAHTRLPEPLGAASPQNLFLFSLISYSSWHNRHSTSCVFSHHPEPQTAPVGASALSVSAAEVEISWQPIAWNRHIGRVLGYEPVLVSDTLQISLSWPYLYPGSSSLSSKSTDNGALHMTLTSNISP